MGPARFAIGFVVVVAMAAAVVPSAAASERARYVGKAQQRDSIDLILGLIREQGSLRRHVDRISDPSSSAYRRYLPISKIQRRFGANPQARTAVREYLAARGASVRFDPTGGAAFVHTSAARAARLFGGEIGVFAARQGGRFIAPSQRLHVPSPLRRYVESVVGARTRSAARSQVVPAPPVSAKDIVLPPRTGTPSGCAEGLAPGGFSPSQIANAHGFTELQRAGVRGEGRIVSLLEFGGGINRSDMNTFASCFGLKADNIVAFAVGIPQPFNASSPAGDEATLDVQVLMGMAPRLKRISLYEGSGNANFYPVLAAALDSRVGGKQLPDAISVSYGVCEPLLANLEGSMEVRLDRYLLLAAAAAGVTVSFSSGDSGSSACAPFAPTVTAPYTNYPATQPFTTAVGGSSMTLRADNQINDQRTWNDTVYGVPPAEAGGGGGGSSGLFSRPAYQPKPAGEEGRGARKVPDISFYADEVPGWTIYCTGTAYECGKRNGYLRVGGTSAASPTFAAMIALTNQYAAQRGVRKVGFVNPLLYELGGERSNVFYDITQGTNDIFGVGCCSAAPGYDPATGWGSARAHRFAIGATRAGDAN